MIDIQELLSALPKMKSGKELASDMAILPKYDSNIRYENQAVRLMGLSNIYNVFIPSAMSMEVYSKLYLALLRSLQKKGTIEAVKQQYENHKAIKQQEYKGIIGGSDSFTVIGTSGIGKSSSISRAISLITENRIIKVENPYTQIIPCVVVQCPFDSSVKGLLLEILRKVDEIQNVVNSKNGKSLIGSLTQLINNSGISIAMIGTPESTIFFESAMHLARRSLGLQYSPLEYGTEFVGICKVLYSYQYVQQKTEITDAIMEWLYEHSSGIISVVVSLIHDAQEIAILNGKEILSLETLNDAYQKRLSLLHEYINPTIIHKGQTSKPKKKVTAANMGKKSDMEELENINIVDLAKKAKSENMDIVFLLKEHFTVVEVTV